MCLVLGYEMYRYILQLETTATPFTHLAKLRHRYDFVVIFALFSNQNGSCSWLSLGCLEQKHIILEDFVHVLSRLSLVLRYTARPKWTASLLMCIESSTAWHLRGKAKEDYHSYGIDRASEWEYKHRPSFISLLLLLLSYSSFPVYLTFKKTHRTTMSCVPFLSKSPSLSLMFCASCQKDIAQYYDHLSFFAFRKIWLQKHRWHCYVLRERAVVPTNRRK